MTNEEIVKLIQNGKAEYTTTLLEKNKGFIYTTALRFYNGVTGNNNGMFIELDDLVQEGSIGLLIAVNKHDTNKEYSFWTYESYYIKLKIRKYLTHNATCIRFPDRVIELNLKRNKYIIKYISEYNRTPTKEEIKEYLKITDEMMAIVDKYEIAKNVTSIYIPVKSNNQEEDLCLADTFQANQDIEADYIYETTRTEIRENIDSKIRNILVDNRLYDVFQRRIYKNETLQEIADEYCLSKEAIRQKMKRAFAMLKKDKDIIQYAKFYNLFTSTRNMTKKEKLNNMMSSIYKDRFVNMLTMNDIAKKYGINKRTVAKYCSCMANN